MALGVITLTYLGKVEAKDFIMLAGMAFTYYFTSKGNASENTAGK